MPTFPQSARTIRHERGRNLARLDDGFRHCWRPDIENLWRRVRTEGGIVLVDAPGTLEIKGDRRRLLNVSAWTE